MFMRRNERKLKEALVRRMKTILDKRNIDLMVDYVRTSYRKPTPQETTGWARAAQNTRQYVDYNQPIRVNTVDTSWLLRSSSSCSDYSPSYASEPSSSASSSSCSSSSESSSADSGSCGGSD